MHKQQTYQLSFLRHLPYNSTRNLVETKTTQNSCHFLAFHNAMKPTLLASMVPFLPELSVRGEAAPKKTNKSFELYTVAQSLDHIPQTQQRNLLSLSLPHTQLQIFARPKQITSTKKLVSESQH
jgi:hypothetical protein